MSKTNKPIGRKDEIVIQEVDGEVLIYDLRNDKAFCLNATSAAIWKLCDGDKSVAEIADRVAKEFKATNSEDLVWLALDQLKKEKLIDGGLDAKYDHFNGLSRRQVIREIGFGSMVALPLVASLVAPSALMAQTGGLANLASCTADGQCMSGNCNNTPGPGSQCCAHPSGTLLAGQDAGPNITVAAPPANCPGVPTANRNAACQAQRGSACCPGNAAWDGGTCSPSPGAFVSIDCDCAA